MDEAEPYRKMINRIAKEWRSIDSGRMKVHHYKNLADFDRAIGRFHGLRADVQRQDAKRACVQEEADRLTYAAGHKEDSTYFGEFHDGQANACAAHRHSQAPCGPVCDNIPNR